MSNTAAYRLGRWLDDPPAAFTSQDVADLTLLLNERKEDTHIVKQLFESSQNPYAHDLAVNTALATLYTQFYGRILLAESDEY
jgi:hypothetical protein